MFYPLSHYYKVMCKYLQIYVVVYACVCMNMYLCIDVHFYMCVSFVHAWHVFMVCWWVTQGLSQLFSLVYGDVTF